MLPTVFRHSLRVTYAHCTMGNHVYYARYLDILEDVALARPMRLYPFRHRPYTLWQRRLGLLSEDSLGFTVIRERNSYFVARVQMHKSALGLHGLGNDPRQVIDRIRHIRSHIENLIPRTGNIHGARDNRSHIVDVRERPDLRSIAENRHRLAPVRADAGHQREQS